MMENEFRDSIIASSHQYITVKKPQIKKTLYWCPVCNIPLLGRHCRCGAAGKEVPLLRPYDVRPALEHDHDLLVSLLSERFGTRKIQKIVLLNKTGGIDRNDLIIMNGERFGWLNFDPCDKQYTINIGIGALPYILPDASRGIIDITDSLSEYRGKRIGGKKIPVDTNEREGNIIIKAGRKYGVGILKDKMVRIKQLGNIESPLLPDPDWDSVIRGNIRHLKNLERNAIRVIRRHLNNNPKINVSFSGGKDSTAVLELARRSGVHDVYFVDTGMEFPETLSFIREMEIPTILKGADFWQEISRHGPPRKDDRWCCDRLKLNPVKQWLKEGDECVTVQGNRWYESFARAGLLEVAVNPYNPRQVNLSPIRNWRALEVFLYIWWRKLPLNPLYDMGFERVGCWNCPAMLESEFDLVKRNHPDLYQKWYEYLRQWGKENRLPESYIRCGLWRWKELPPKMKELISTRKISIRPKNEVKKKKTTRLSYK
jgi:3'-phosphoadenosine 5'-phosphosulfate sulfotransferase (PAPS reductase)/FAD synthetase/predicted RNA-binding protein with PUA domain